MKKDESVGSQPYKLSYYSSSPDGYFQTKNLLCISKPTFDLVKSLIKLAYSLFKLAYSLNPLKLRHVFCCSLFHRVVLHLQARVKGLSRTRYVILPAHH